jgi:hypothetical protein
VNGRKEISFIPKLFQNKFETESSCKAIMPRTHRAAYAYVRCGVAPIRLKTGRYARIPAKKYCPFCPTQVEEDFMLFLNVCYMMICAKFYMPKRYLFMCSLIL